MVLHGVLYRSSDTKMDLQSAISDAIVAMDLFFNNRFAESETMFEKWYEEFKFFFQNCVFGSVIRRLNQFGLLFSITY